MGPPFEEPPICCYRFRSSPHFCDSPETSCLHHCIDVMVVIILPSMPVFQGDIPVKMDYRFKKSHRVEPGICHSHIFWCKILICFLHPQPWGASRGSNLRNFWNHICLFLHIVLFIYECVHQGSNLITPCILFSHVVMSHVFMHSCAVLVGFFSLSHQNHVASYLRKDTHSPYLYAHV